MLTVNKLLPQGQGLAPVLLKRAAIVELDWDVRQKSRFDATDNTGRVWGVFLPRGTLVRGGDVLVGEDGSMIRVVAAPQPVLVIKPCADHGSAFDLVRAAYHLGNRHVQIELQPDHLKIEPDHVLADMLRAMHLTVEEARAAFEPEGGAYASGGHAHGHAHADHGHGHAEHGEPGHVHGPGCGHGDHGHAHAAPTTAPAAARGKPVGIAVRPAGSAPHVHGPHCNHEHNHDHGHEHHHGGHEDDTPRHGH